jgi:hypothetical protein
MEEKEIIKQFVLGKDMGNGRESCLMKALEDARRLYAKEELWRIINAPDFDCLSIDKRIELVKRMEISFLSLIGYLISLDLIGTVFAEPKTKPKTKPKTETKTNITNAIINAIETFGSPELKECKYAVNALRNSLAHNYGLVNTPYKLENDKESLHKFTLSEEENNDGNIFDRKQEWERGNWKDKNENSSTVVNVRKLIKEIENLIENLQEKAKNGKLPIYLDGNINELYARFTIIKD